MRQASLVNRLLHRLLLVAGGSALLVVAAGPDSGGCEVSTEAPQVQCVAVADCEGLAHDLCVGAWQCQAGSCQWDCAQAACASDSDCAKGQACVGGKCQAVQPACVQSGCSGEVCAAEAVYTSCIWQDWFACLKLTTCGAFGDGGACGFEQNDAFLKCVAGGVGCSTDADCAAGLWCHLVMDSGGGVSGTCEPLGAGQCVRDADCGDGFRCVVEACPACYPCPCFGTCQPVQTACQTVKPGSHGECKMLLGFIFDGSQCVTEGGCSCDPDCKAFFASLEECQKACGIATGCKDHQECPSGQECKTYCGNGWCSGVCEALPDGECWYDKDCPAGQTCEGEFICQPPALCGPLADHTGKCAGIAPACTALKPGSHGLCDMVLGWIFDGHDCMLESGCGCGNDCAYFFETPEDCKAACLG